MKRRILNIASMLTIAVITGLCLYAPVDAWAAITIPNAIEVDAFGTQVLADAAPGIVSVSAVNVILMLVGLGFAIVMMRTKKIGRAKA